MPGRLRWLAVGAAAAVAVLAVTLFVILSTDTDERPQPCQGPFRPGGSGSAWTCSFADEFGGRRLDTTKWQVINTLRVGFRSGPECYVDDARHVRVTGGHLVLTATRGGYCPASNAPYESGMVSTQQRFGQAYGRFEIRARLPDRRSFQPALWLYPHPLAYGPWPRSGEIDVAEVFGLGKGQVWPHLHYLGADGQETHPGQACTVRNVASAFHTYGVTWTPSAISFDYDGTTCLRETGWRPAAPLQAPAPFDRPFAVLLEMALSSLPDQVPDATTVFPQSLTVDWVRVWHRPAG